MADAEDKLTALVAWLGEILRSHVPDFRVSRVVARGTLDGAMAQLRDETMGRPARYCEVEWIGEDESSPGMLRGPGASTMYVPDLFRVQLWYGFTPAASWESWTGTTEQRFLQLLKAPADDDRPGLLSALRATKVLPVGSGADADGALVGDPRGVIADRAGEGDEINHYCEFTITLA